MITSVCISGKLSYAINEYTRYVEVEKVASVDGQIVTDLIPVANFNKNPKAHFMKLNDGAYVIIKGRLETIEKIGLVVVLEMFEVLANNQLHIDVEDEEEVF